jgi:dTDP-4-amino-4,6-dideoxygalactose transaminase
MPHLSVVIPVYESVDCLVTSCTSALEVAVMIGDTAAGDEVILPSFTFASAADAVVRAGAWPVSVDIEGRHLSAVLVDPQHREWALRAEGIGAAFHYVPLHSAPFGSRQVAAPAQLPVADRVAASLARLPLYAGLSRRDREDVVSAVGKVLGALAADA